MKRWEDTTGAPGKRTGWSPVRFLRRYGLVALLVLGPALFAPAQELPPPDEAAVIEQVDVQGNQYLQKETFLFYVSTKAGERYDERRLKDDFRRLWDTGLVDDMVLNVFDGRKGKVVVFQVKERKRTQIVDFRGSKVLTTSVIEDKLKEKEAALKIDTLYDEAKARRVDAIIREMLLEKGRPFGTVKHDAKNIGGSGMQVSFIIDDGPKAKVKQIEFLGNQVFSDRTLRARMKRIKNIGKADLWSLFTGPVRWGKTTYSEDRWSEPDKGDRANLQDFYLNNGYVTASVGEPRVSYIDGTAGLFHKKPVKWVRLEIPVSEGEQYRVGEVKFEGLTVFKEENLRPIFKLQTGDVYKEARIRKGYDKLRDAYGSQGYFQWTALTKRTPDPQRKVVDVVLSMEEDKKYFVGQIRFTGNDTTRDKVIRREVYLNEGDVFNTEALKLSIRRINQLGYFKPMEKPPQIMPSRTEDKLDVVFKVEEQNRNQFTFGGGVSGLEGTFVNASFSTANFLGLGETLQLSAQSGRRTKNYQLAVTEPYLFDRAITAGFDLFSRKIIYDSVLNVVGFSQEETGGSLVSGLPVGHFSRLFGNYTYQTVSIRSLNTTSFQTAVVPPTTVTDAFTPTTPLTSSAPTFDPLANGQGRTRESMFTPSYIYNSVDNPYTPHSGRKVSVTPQIAGGPLGGTLSYFHPEMEFIIYLPTSRRTALGMRLQGAYIRPYGKTVELPFYKRFFMGGENEIRGTNIRTVGPVDENNNAIGGNKSVLFNAEYYFDIAGPLRALLFFDAGQTYKKGDFFDLRQLRTSTGVEMRFIMPVINVPFRLIYAFNPNRDAFQPARTFKFAVGTTF